MTSIGGVALCGASRSSYYRFVFVTKCFGFISGVAVATSGASIGSVAAVFAIGSSYYCLILVTECFGLISGVAVTASGASIGSVAAVLTVGCSYYRLILVTECFGLISGVAVTASGASIGGVAAVLTIGFSYYCLVIMTKRCNLALIGKRCLVAGTSIVLTVTELGAGGILSTNEGNTLVKSDLDGVEVVIAAYGSYGKNRVSKSKIGVIFGFDLLAAVKLVGGVSGITVDDDLGARLQEKLEGAVLYLRIVTAIVADLNTGEINNRILVVAIRTEGDGGVLNDGSVDECIKNDALDISVVVTILTGYDNYLCLLLGGEGVNTAHSFKSSELTVKVNIEYAILRAVTANGYSSACRNNEVNSRIRAELIAVTVISEATNKAKSTVGYCRVECSLCGKCKALILTESSKEGGARGALTVYPDVTKRVNAYGLARGLGAAYGTVCNIVVRAAYNTAGSYIVLNYYRAVGVGNHGYSLCLCSCATDSTLLMLSTGSGTGRSLVNDEVAGLMSEGSNILLLNESDLTHTANRACGHTASGTGSRCAENLNRGMSKNCNKGRATSLAELRIDAGSRRTGSMSVRLTIGIATGSTGLRGNAISLYPVVSVGLTPDKGTELTYRRLGTGRIKPLVRALDSDYRNNKIGGYILHLESIGLNTVLCGGRSYGNTILYGESVVNADHEIEHRVLTLSYGKSVTKEGCAILLGSLHSNYECGKLSGQSVRTHITKTIAILIGMCVSRNFLAALTLVIVECLFLFPIISNGVQMLRLLRCWELILKHDSTGSERE